MSKHPSSAASTTVNDLIRAAAGGDAHNVRDEDLDKYVADLLAKEAAAKRTKYDQVGVRAFLPTGLPPNKLPKPNKRFLMNMVKATDSHNRAIIRQAEQKAVERTRHRHTRSRSPEPARRCPAYRSKRKQSLSPSHRDEGPKRRHRSRSPDSVANPSLIPPDPSLDPKRDSPPSERHSHRHHSHRSRRESIDTDHDNDSYREKTKKRKKDKKKKKRKRDHEKSRSDEDEPMPRPPPVRAWDIGK